MKIHTTITDFPVLSRVETSFRNYKKGGVDAVEIVLGIKSRASIRQIKKLSEKYNLPIASVHQPAWSFFGIFFDDEFIKYALELGTKYIVCHPLAFHTFDSTAQKKYFEKMAKAQEKYGVHIMLENMGTDRMYKKLHQFPITPLDHLSKISTIADEYGFLLTYDVSHAELTHPQDEKIFHDMFSKIGNIHLSSFIHHDHHLPVTMGDLDTKGLLTYLQKRKYAGLLTLEVYYPQWSIRTKQAQFKAIADSVAMIKKITDK